MPKPTGEGRAMNIRQCRGNRGVANPQFPHIVPVSQALFLAVGMFVPATDRARPWHNQGTPSYRTVEMLVAAVAARTAPQAAAEFCCPPAWPFAGGDSGSGMGLRAATGRRSPASPGRVSRGIRRTLTVDRQADHEGGNGAQRSAQSRLTGLPACRQEAAPMSRALSICRRRCPASPRWPEPTPLPGLVRQHDCACPICRRCPRRPQCALAPRPRLRPRHAPARPPRGRPRPYRAGRAARADLRLPEPPHGAPGSVLRGDRCQGRRLRPHGRQRAAAAEGARDPELGAPLRRALGRRPLRARAGDQRLRRAAGEPVARLPAASRAARARCLGTWGDPPPMLSAVAQAALEGDLAGKVQALASDPKDGLAAALARLGRAFMARNS